MKWRRKENLPPLRWNKPCEGLNEARQPSQYSDLYKFLRVTCDALGFIEATQRPSRTQVWSHFIAATTSHGNSMSLKSPGEWGGFLKNNELNETTPEENTWTKDHIVNFKSLRGPTVNEHASRWAYGYRA